MIIGLTGRIAAGKEEVVSFFENRGFIHFDISDLVRDEVIYKEKLKVTRKNLQDIGNYIRQEEGADAWIHRMFKFVHKDRDYIIDGIKNSMEVELLKKQKEFILIAIDAPREQRFQRAIRRKRPSDPKTWGEFLEIDERDFCEDDPMGQQVGKCMEMADYLIVNDTGPEELENKIEGVWGRISNNKKSDIN